MSTSSCNMSHWSWPRPEVMVCNHGIEAEIVTSKTDANPGRRFYRCYIWKEDDCKFFRWIDPSLSPNQENFMKKLKMERDSMEKELQARVAMQDMLKEKVSSKEVEIESLQTVAENLRRHFVFMCRGLASYLDYKSPDYVAWNSEWTKELCNFQG